MKNAATSQDIRERVIVCLRNISKRQCEITDATNTFCDLGLKSEDGIFIACAFEEEFGIVVPHDINPLIEESGTKFRPRRVSEVVQFVLEAQSAQENHHAPF